MSAIVTARCCCEEPPATSLYSASKCPSYDVNQCAAACGDCCSGVGTPSTIYFCDTYLSAIGFSPGSFNSLNCYYVEYLDCIYVIDIVSTGPCPTSPPYPEPYNVGGYHDIKVKGAQPCCRPSGPVVPCDNDIIVDAFPYSDPWGITNPVKVSGNMKACVIVSGTDYAICGSNQNEWMVGGPREVTHNTYQEVGKCWERNNPDVPIGPCDRSTGGAEYLNKFGMLNLNEQWDPCTCTGTPGGALYSRTVEKCYGVNECSGAKCWGYCDDPVNYNACVSFRNANDICDGVSDPMKSYTLDTSYMIIKSCKTYYDPPDLPCECDYYEDDALRISFPLCYATNAGLDPTDPSDHPAIKAMYQSKVSVENFCSSSCTAATGWGTLPVSCIDICKGEGIDSYHLDIFSSSAGAIAAKINSKFGGKVTASSLADRKFWFGYRQNTSACGGDPNTRPPYGPGDLMEFDRVEIDIAAWKARVYIKGKSTRFRYCVSQVLQTNAVSGRATCMSSNAVSPAEWGQGTRPNLIMVKTNSVSQINRCECPSPATVTDCTSVGTYEQNTITSGMVVVPGYTEQFQNPCGTEWLTLDCKTYACCQENGCSCDDCGTCSDCCECVGSFGNPQPPNCPCDPHVINQGIPCGCSIPSNQQLSILP